MLTVRSHALGDLPQYRGLDEAGLDAVGVQLGLAQVEVVDVPGECVLLVQCECLFSSAPSTAASQAWTKTLVIHNLIVCGFLIGLLVNQVPLATLALGRIG